MLLGRANFPEAPADFPQVSLARLWVTGPFLKHNHDREG